MVNDGNYLGAKRSQNELSEFYCAKCDYATSKNGNWHRHLKTKKHNATQMVSDGNCLEPKGAEGPKELDATGHSTHKCNCGREYAHLSGLSRHKRTCTYEPPTKAEQQNQIVSTIAPEQLMELLRENKELRELLTKQSSEVMGQMVNMAKTVSDVAKVAGNNNTVSTNSHNTNIILQLNSNYPNALPIQQIVERIMALPYCVTHDPKLLTDAITNILTVQTDEQRTIRSVKNTLYVKEDTGFKEDKNVEVFDTIKKSTERDQVGKAATQNPNLFHREKEGKEYSEMISGVMKELTPREKKKMKNGIIGAIGNDDML